MPVEARPPVEEWKARAEAAEAARDQTLAHLQKMRAYWDQAPAVKARIEAAEAALAAERERAENETHFRHEVAHKLAEAGFWGADHAERMTWAEAVNIIEGIRSANCELRERAARAEAELARAEMNHESGWCPAKTERDAATARAAELHKWTLEGASIIADEIEALTHVRDMEQSEANVAKGLLNATDEALCAAMPEICRGGSAFVDDCGPVYPSAVAFVGTLRAALAESLSTLHEVKAALAELLADYEVQCLAAGNDPKHARPSEAAKAILGDEWRCKGCWHDDDGCYCDLED